MNIFRTELTIYNSPGSRERVPYSFRKRKLPKKEGQLLLKTNLSDKEKLLYKKGQDQTKRNNRSDETLISKEL